MTRKDNKGLSVVSATVGAALAVALLASLAPSAEPSRDHLRDLQAKAIEQGRAPWGHWGSDPNAYAGWTSHSNRLVPCYTYGLSLDEVSDERSVYRDAERLKALYGQLPEGTLNSQAEYFDQTDVYRLQQSAIKAGKKHIVLIVFDGMDWQTTWAAAIQQSQKVGYQSGRGTGLAFQDYDKAPTDFGYFVCSPHNDGTRSDVNAQTVLNPGGAVRGGYDPRLGGPNPWTAGADPAYIISKNEQRKHAYTDSASAATSMTAGIKTYNDAINVDWQGDEAYPIARQLQAQGFAIGVVTSVPISHATPACAYASNVSRDDYQDLTRDLLGLPSISHLKEPLPGVDVLIGAGWGQISLLDANQGSNFVPGNKYLTADDRAKVDVGNGGKYEVAERQAGVRGAESLLAAASVAAQNGRRLFGYYGMITGHLPFQTANGDYSPTRGAVPLAESYNQETITENPTLAEMTQAALTVLEKDEQGFWLMIEAGDVDWANHDDNLDNSIGAVKSGDAAFRTVVEWIEAHGGWDQAAVILTADHGHYLVLDQPEALLDSAGR